MKYQEWMTVWLNDYMKSSLKWRTYMRYSEIANQHIGPNLGNYDLNELTPFMIQQFVSSLLTHGNLRNGDGLSSNSVNSIINVIQNSLKTAHAFGYTDYYIADKIKRPKTFEKATECFTYAEQKKIEMYIANSNQTKLYGILLCLYTGLRIGELLALEWADIDFDRKELHVNKTCHDGRNQDGCFGRIIDTPKTQSSVRIIPIPKQIVPLLCHAQKESHSIYLISNGSKPISIRSYQRTFSLIQQKLEMPHRGFHSLRHTFATRALECGMDVKTLSEILGHKSPTVTLNRYVHSLIEHKKEMMNKLGELL